MTPSLPQPSRAEEIAAFRLGIVGDLLARELSPGELKAELQARAEARYRPPNSPVTRQFHWKTLQKWLYLAKRRGLKGLVPKSRAKGHGLALEAEARELLLQIRREHISAPADIILREAERQGVVPDGVVSVSTLRRVFADSGVSRAILDRHDRVRRKWNAAAVGDLWHSDVCHIWVRRADGPPRRLFVHALLDDHSRYVVALEAREAEREVDFLAALCGALLQFPAPTALYVDNGACYRGEVLALTLDRLGVRLIHAKPYEPRSRGEMERFWRTFRSRLADLLPTGATLQDVNAALLAFLDADYHKRPHAGLLGEPPGRRFAAGLRALGRPRTARDLSSALEVPTTRKIRGDLTFDVDGQTWETTGRHLSGHKIQLVLDPFTRRVLRATVGGVSVPVGPCDPIANGRRRRPVDRPAPVAPAAPFDPIVGLLEKARSEVADE
jgi:transposase InsO family protein